MQNVQKHINIYIYQFLLLKSQSVSFFYVHRKTFKSVGIVSWCWYSFPMIWYRSENKWYRPFQNYQSPLMEDYIDEVRKLEEHFDGLQMEHVPRAQNAIADGLSKCAALKIGRAPV